MLIRAKRNQALLIIASMAKPKIYIETTVISYVFNRNYPERQKVARRVFDLVKNREIEAFISDVVLGEIDKAPNKLREKLSKLVRGIKVLPVTREVDRLVEKYLEEQVFPKTKRADATHVAIATVAELDFVFSWNFRHIVRVWTKERVEAVNKLLEYRTPKIVIPEEVI